MPLVDQDQEHLRLLSIIYYIYAGMTAFFGLFGALYMVIGIVFAVNPPPTATQGDPKIMGYLFTALGGLFFLLAVVVTAAEFLVARYLKRRRHHTFCVIVAGFNCLWVPVGTALGVCTILVLQRPAVKALFGYAAPVSPPEPPAIPSI
jgi:hypothetical protein